MYYFLSVPVLECLKMLTEKGGTVLHLFTNAKRSCIAFEEPAHELEGPGLQKSEKQSIRNEMPTYKKNIR